VVAIQYIHTYKYKEKQQTKKQGKKAMCKSSWQNVITCKTSITIDIQDKDKILITSLYLKGYSAKSLTDKFPEKSWTKQGVNKLLKKLRVTGTANKRPGSGRPRSARTEENVETLNGLVLS